MTFGVLEAITGQKIPESLLLSHRDDGTLVLTSKKVSRLISYWLFGLPPVRHHNRVMQWAEETGKILTWASGAINEEMMSSKTEFLISAAGLTRDEFNDMLCSLSFFYNWLFQPLLQYVRCASTIITSSSVPRFYDAPHAAIFAIVDGLTRRMGLMVTNYNPFTNIFKERLIAGGWCPSAPAILQSNLFALGLATTLVPFHRYSPPEHKKCSAERCSAHNLDPDKYVTQHAPGCSDPEGCPFLSPPLARVSDVLGNVPSWSMMVMNSRYGALKMVLLSRSLMSGRTDSVAQLKRGSRDARSHAYQHWCASSSRMARSGSTPFASLTPNS